MADKNMFLKNYYFYGYQAEKVKKLIDVVDNESNAKIFEYAIDLFIVAAAIGVKNNHKVKQSNDKTNTFNIFAEQFNNHSHELELVFKFVTLLGNQNIYDEETRLNKAFRNPNTDENFSVFEEYMLGGIDDLYDMFFVDSNKIYRDYSMTMNKFVSDLSNPVQEDDDDIPDDDIDF